MQGEGGLFELTNAARTRALLNAAIEAGCIAVSVALGGMIVLLLAGTEILEWYWIPALFMAGLIVGIARARRKVPTPYGLLQRVDSRLNLHDTLSTAFFFAELAESRTTSNMARVAQRSEAENLCRSLEPKRAVPLALPRTAYIALLLSGGAAGLLAARYAVHHSLDLRPPISRALVEFFRPSPEQMARSAEPDAKMPEFEQISAETGQDQRRPESRQTDAPPPGNVPPALSPAPIAQHGDPPAALEDSASSGEERETANSKGKDESARSDERDTPPSAPDQDKAGGDQKPQPPSEEESDLIRKMQDAFANLLSKLKIPPMAGEGRRPSDRGSSEAGRSEQAKGQQGEESPEGADAEGTPVADPRGREQTASGQQAQQGKGEGGDQLSNQPGQEQANSGIGTKDGSKELKMREQEEAMGKLSEILGKRAENIMGEVMVEVSSGEQRLTTPYDRKRATHNAAEGEIHRDEVPLVYHDYVQRYFAEVHKSGAGDKPPAEPATSRSR